MIDNFSLIVCNYNTPLLILGLLKSWKFTNSNVTNNLLLVDNSTNEDSAKILHELDINFIRNPGGTHYEGVQIALDYVNTDYALLVDSDVLFKKSIENEVKYFIDNNLTLMGEECGDRGGLSLYTRIHPWFCFINIKNIKEHNIKFTNMEKVLKTDSGGLYTNIPYSPNVSNKRYDVGATFYEDILENRLTTCNKKLDPEYFYHYEGMSWRGKSIDKLLVNINTKNEINYSYELRRLGGIEIKGWFK